tara:strand:- start:140 stop:361 length:222 start_codon:yes stop_codon:yes gene_type:complete
MSRNTGRNRSEAQIERGYRERLDKTKSQIDNRVAAARWPGIMKALDSLPPTPSELDKILLSGYPKGYGNFKKL